MRKKLVLGTILTLSLLIVTVFVAVAPAFAVPKDDSNITVYGNEAAVKLQLPPPGGAVAGHPTNLKLTVEDWSKRSETGAFDNIMIGVWSPAANAYVPMASVIDIPIPAWWKAMWNGTFLYLEVNGVVIRNNLISVADKELDVWTESVSCGYGHKGWNDASDTMVSVNLTVPVPISNIGLPPPLGLPSFTLPPTNMKFQQIGEGWRVDDEPGASFPSGYVVSRKYTEAPAWVRVGIKGWVSEYEVVGSIVEHETRTATPPAST